MKQQEFVYTSKVVLLCFLAAVANFLLNTLCIQVFKIPLYLDTVFTAAVCFTVGLGPGILTALLTYLGLSLRDGVFTPFIICAVTEVLLICWLKPVDTKKRYDTLPKLVAVVVSFIGIFIRLLLLYIVAYVAISILGGIIDSFYSQGWSIGQSPFSPDDPLRTDLLERGFPRVVVNIISRIRVNMIDHFIVIYGGYFVSRGLKWFQRG